MKGSASLTTAGTMLAVIDTCANLIAIFINPQTAVVGHLLNRHHFHLKKSSDDDPDEQHAITAVKSTGDRATKTGAMNQRRLQLNPPGARETLATLIIISSRSVRRGAPPPPKSPSNEFRLDG